MNSSSRIPPLLQPYVELPRDDSLLLLTSTLGASANWLLIRFLCNALGNNIPHDGGADEGHNVVLASWMRDYEFWKQEVRKGAGLDLERLRREKRFAFVDGLSGLVMGHGEDAQAQPLPHRTSPMSPARGLPGRIAPARGPLGRIVPTIGPPAPSATAAAPPSTINSQTTAGHHTLTSLDLTHLKTTLTAAVSSLISTPQRKTLLILDAPDLPLALTSTSPSALTALVLHLHATPTVSHVLTHLHADTPLLTPSAPPQPLETAHYNVVAKVAHMARRVIGTRVLDTGVARDVSGVVRVTEQRVGWADLGLEGEDEGEDARPDAADSGKAKEFLYQVRGDGSVKVFERGACGEG